MKFGDMKHVIENEHPTVLALRAEIERLTIEARDAWTECVRRGEIVERLRAALKQIAASDGHAWMYRRIANEALGEQGKG